MSASGELRRTMEDVQRDIEDARLQIEKAETRLKNLYAEERRFLRQRANTDGAE